MGQDLSCVRHEETEEFVFLGRQPDFKSVYPDESSKLIDYECARSENWCLDLDLQSVA